MSPLADPNGFEISLHFEDASDLLRALGRIPKELHREVRPRLRELGQDTMREAQANASWSSRIPRALSVRVSLNSRRPGVSIRASLKVAPHARALEGILDDPFKHPVFGDETTWVAQRARPYLLPATHAAGPRLRQTVVELLDEVHRRVGLL